MSHFTEELLQIDEYRASSPSDCESTDNKSPNDIQKDKEAEKSEDLDVIQQINQTVDLLFDQVFPGSSAFDLTEAPKKSGNDNNQDLSTVVPGSPTDSAESRASSPSSSVSDCLDTVEELIAAAKRVYYRNPARELEKEKKKAERNQIKDPVKNPDTDLSSILSTITPETLNLIQNFVPSQQNTDSSTKIDTSSTPPPNLEQTQALLICQLQIPEDRLKDPEFLKNLQTTHPEFQSVSGDINFNRLIENLGLKLTNVIKSFKAQTFTLMVNAVPLNASLFLFISIAFYSKLTRRLESFFLGLRVFSVVETEVCQNIRPIIEEDEHTRNAFFVRTGVQLDPNEMDFEQINEILHLHCQTFVEISQEKCQTEQAKCVEATKWHILDAFQRLKKLCQTQLEITSPEKLLTVDYVYPLFHNFLTTLKKDFKPLGRLPVQIFNVFKYDFAFIVNREHRSFVRLFTEAVALNFQVKHYLRNTSFGGWKKVLKTRCISHFRNKLQSETEDVGPPNKRKKHTAGYLATNLVNDNARDIYSKNFHNMKERDKIDFNYNAIESWERIKCEELRDIAIDVLQNVSTSVFPTQILRQMLLNWLSNQTSNPATIRDEDLPTIERNTFVYLNQKFLL